MSLAGRHLARLKRRCRVLLLLDAAEQVGIAPLPSARLHAFAYLADVLSPVWKLVPFDGKIYKSDGGPTTRTCRTRLTVSWFSA